MICKEIATNTFTFKIHQFKTTQDTYYLEEAYSHGIHLYDIRQRYILTHNCWDKFLLLDCKDGMTIDCRSRWTYNDY